MDFVSWDDEIPNIWKNNPNVPNHEPVIERIYQLVFLRVLYLIQIQKNVSLYIGIHPAGMTGNDGMDH